MDLKFDKMTVNTSKAEVYFKEVKKAIELNESKYYNGENFNDVKVAASTTAYKDNCSKLEILATKLKENLYLFQELEYFVRKIPVEDTTAQINLIIKQILYVACQSTAELDLYNIIPETVPIHRNSPLCELGSTIKALAVSRLNLIIGLHESVAICYLFTKLCHDSGFNINTRFIIKDNDSFVDEGQCIVVPVGAVAVVSELSDVDSAVHALSTSSIHVPWKIQKIFVQESVYEQFKSTLNWKSNLGNEGDGDTNASPHFIEYNGRQFMFDIEMKVRQENAVNVEAYRTRKELISLLRENQAHYLSLWANDIAEINEITHSVNSQLIWVNNIGDFRGPPKVSEAVYSLFSFSIKPSLKHEVNLHELTKLKESWQKLDLESRREILCKGLNDYLLKSGIEMYRTCEENIRRYDPLSSGTFIDVGKDYVCLGMPAPANVLCSSSGIITTDLFRSILLGNAFCITKYFDIINILKKAGVPIVHECDVLKKYSTFVNDCKNSTHIFYVTKVIWTNSGTIFAN